MDLKIAKKDFELALEETQKRHRAELVEWLNKHPDIYQEFREGWKPWNTIEDYLDENLPDNPVLIGYIGSDLGCPSASAWLDEYPDELT